MEAAGGLLPPGPQPVSGRRRSPGAGSVRRAGVAAMAVKGGPGTLGRLLFKLSLRPAAAVFHRILVALAPGGVAGRLFAGLTEVDDFGHRQDPRGQDPGAGLMPRPEVLVSPWG